MYYKKQQNNTGNYKDKENVRYEILMNISPRTVIRVDTGKTKNITASDGSIITLPVIVHKVILLPEWSTFKNLEEAAQSYELTPITE